MRVLVFGAGGYIGIPLCEALVAAGHEKVGAVDRWFFGKYPRGCLIYTEDIRNFYPGLFSGQSQQMGWQEKFPAVWDVVIDLAGLSNDASCDIDLRLTQEINEEGGKRIATLAAEAGVKRYIYSSSAAVYGHGRHMSLTEESELHPLTHYAQCKVKVEDHIRNLQATHSHFKPVILRNATVFGVAPRMRFDLAVNVMTLRAVREGVIYIMGGGEQWRPFVHVRDVVDLMCKMVKDKDVCGTFNVGSENAQMTIKKLAMNVKATFEAKIHQIPDDVDLRSYHLSFDKLRQFSMGFRSVMSGIHEIADAVNRKEINPDDPICYTLQYYKTMLEWDKRLENLRLDGVLL